MNRTMTRTLAFATAAGVLFASLACSSLSRPGAAAAHDTKQRTAAAKQGLTPGGGSEGDFVILPGTKIPSIEARHSIGNVTSRPLIQMARPPAPPTGPLRDIEMEKGPDAERPRPPLRHDPVLQSRAGAGMPTPDLNFEGVPNVNGVQPADTTMAIGPNHVFQWVNLSFQVFPPSDVE